MQMPLWLPSWPADGIFAIKMPPKEAKREPSRRQKEAKTSQNGSKKACKVASKNSMPKSRKKEGICGREPCPPRERPGTDGGGPFLVFLQ